MDGSTTPRLIPGPTINYGYGPKAATTADVRAWNRAPARSVALSAKSHYAMARTRARGRATTPTSPARSRAPRARRATTRAASAHGPPSRPAGDEDPEPPQLALRGATLALARFETRLRRRTGRRQVA